MIKKPLALILTTGITFSATVAQASAVDLSGIKVPAISSAMQETAILNNINWAGKPLLNLTAGEAAEFLDFIKRTGQAPAAEKSSGILSWFTDGASGAMSSVFSILGIIVASNVIQTGFNWYHNFVARKNCGYIDRLAEPMEALEKFDTYLSAIKGQKKAKEKLRKIVLSIVDEDKKRRLFSKNGFNYGARIIYMIGPSGVGKSYSADALTKVLTGKDSKPYIIEASDIDRQSDVSPADQLFGMRTKKVSNSEIYECSPLINQLKATPKMVVLINEYDKMHTPDLDERLRTAMDQGYFNVNGEKIDCSQAIFIITSNESSVFVEGGNQQFDADKIDDGTGSRTFVKHDKAFFNRVKLVEFDNLDKEAYKEIAAIPFSDLVERYKSEYGITLDLKNTLDEVAAKTEEINKGARPIYEMVDNLNEEILSSVVLKGAHGEQYRNKSYSISYDKIKDNFRIRQIN